jgi:hypothetical protein
VAVHELGHAHQLGHIIAPRKVMHYALSNGVELRELDPVSDVAGGLNVLENTSKLSMCGESPMIPLIGVGVEKADLPAGYSVAAAFPNPFVDGTTLELRVSHPQEVSAVLFDVLGRSLGTIFAGSVQPAGTAQIEIDGSNLSAGVYFVRIQGERFSTGVPITRN